MCLLSWKTVNSLTCIFISLSKLKCKNVRTNVEFSAVHIVDIQYILNEQINKQKNSGHLLGVTFWYNNIVRVILFFFSIASFSLTCKHVQVFPILNIMKQSNTKHNLPFTLDPSLATVYSFSSLFI